jgi:hypothetical protein
MHCSPINAGVSVSTPTFGQARIQRLQHVLVQAIPFLVDGRFVDTGAV